MQQANAAPELIAAGPVEVYEYPAGANAPRVMDWSGFSSDSNVVTADKPSHGQGAGGIVAPADRANFDKRLAEEKRRAFEEGRQQGILEGRKAERELHAPALASAEDRHARQLAQAVASFASARDSYLQSVEPEVVKLALAVAARILRREAQMDPLLLTGAVRVALGQLAGSTELRLKVPASELELWSEAIQLLPNLALKPHLVAGEGMRLGDCVIEASMGTVDLGIRSQLSEIERGFFDRAGGERHQPAAHVDDAVGSGRDGGR